MCKYEVLQKILLETQYEIPTTINLYQIFEDNNLKNELKHIAKYSYFLHLIFRNQKHTKTFVKLTSKLLRKVITYHIVLRRIKANLLKLGIIDVDNHYIPHVSSMGYKISDQYMNYELSENLTTYLDNNTPTQPTTHPLMVSGFPEDSKNNDITTINKLDEVFVNKQIQRLNKIKGNVNKASKNRFNDLVNTSTLPQYRYIKNNIIRTSVDDEVYQFIKQMVDNRARLRPQRIEIIKEEKKQHVWRKERFMTEFIGKTWIDNVDKVKYGLGTPTCPSNTKRVYSSITSYPGELRGFLRVKGTQLIYMDIRNSQPFLFLYFVLQELGGEIPDDIQLYIDLVCLGKLYDYLMVKMGKTINQPIITREEQLEYDYERLMFKNDFFGKVFFSTEKKVWRERKVFDELFPNVSRVVTKMKINGYKELSLKLQRFESSIIIDKVFNRLATEYPKSYAVPVHDAIICETGMSEIVNEIMMIELYDAIGYKPTIKVEALL